MRRARRTQASPVLRMAGYAYAGRRVLNGWLWALYLAPDGVYHLLHVADPGRQHRDKRLRRATRYVDTGATLTADQLEGAT